MDKNVVKTVGAREVALKILYRTEKEGSFPNLLLSNDLKTLQNPADRALASNFVYGVLKNKLALDHIISKFSKIKLNKLSLWVLNILRIGVFQLLYMDKIPIYAACNESVTLAKRYANKGAVGFVNGVLRAVARDGDKVEFPDRAKNLTEYLSVFYSHPRWIVEKLLNKYGAEVCEEILKTNNSVPNLFIRANLLKTNTSELQEILISDGIDTEIDSEIPCCLKVLSNFGDVVKAKAFTDGLFTVQDRSSTFAGQALEPQPGDVVLDMCAAPGGKTTHLAELMKNTGEIIACDIHEHKLKLISDAARRLGVGIIETNLLDGTELRADFIEKFDKILIDAPCSGLGVLHKKPDIRYAMPRNGSAEEDITELVECQAKLLDNAAKYLKSGGVMVYSTCTILKEENSEQIARFLERHGDFEKLYETQIFTHETGGSGFYICKLRRQASLHQSRD
ncbi:MAG: 16S rRNA (cytosine(967)-C(5))-methyltransferase RsmB [Oscillospiraceae bacterium]|nr:16S rRNA (cytosine(967)-C(5))-methyltransferase RsmB [Oscillospiraceae bacterium]